MDKVSKLSVNYRLGTPQQHCGNCTMFTLTKSKPNQGTCDLVRGVIMPTMVCDKWEAK